mgnify:FL=1
MAVVAISAYPKSSFECSLRASLGCAGAVVVVCSPLKSKWLEPLATQHDYQSYGRTVQLVSIQGQYVLVVLSLPRKRQHSIGAHVTVLLNEANAPDPQWGVPGKRARWRERTAAKVAS